MIKTTQAHIVYTPLLTTFCMKTVGGSPQQKYDALHQVYVPDRQIAELRFIPNLQVQDPDGYVTPIGVAVDMTSKLVNCKWYLNNVQLVAGEDYDFNDNNDIGSITIYHNTTWQESGQTLRFEGEFLDQRRQEVLKFTWETIMTLTDYTDYNITFELNVPSKTLLSPFKDRGNIVVSACFYNGHEAISANRCQFLWQIYDDRVNGWRDLGLEGGSDQIPEDGFYVSGQDTQNLVVRQDCIEDVLIRCIGVFMDWEETKTFRMKRYYGQYDERIDIAVGKYISPETPLSKAIVTVTNKQGDIANPEKFFDIEVLFKSSFRQNWQNVAYGTEGIVYKESLGTDYSSKPTFGCLVREKTALLPLVKGNRILSVGGKPIYVSVPKVERDIE